MFVSLLILPAPASGASLADTGGHRCSADPDRVITKLFRHRQERQRRQRPAREGVLATTEAVPATLPDAGNIAVVDDSEGAVIRPNSFDMRQRTLRFSPSGAGASQYTAATQALGFDSGAAGAGNPITGLQDDDSRLVQLPFQFPFYGQRYTFAYINSDGNLTFTSGDNASTARSLSRAISGPARIFPFFTDLDPSRPDAAVSYFAAADRVVITWNRVPQFAQSGIGLRQTFQAALYRDGGIEFHYSDVNINDAVVGIAPGQLRNGFQAADLSQGTAAPFAGALAEVFSSRSDMDELVISEKFYRNHDDAYDFLVLFNDLSLSLDPGTFAYELNVRNRVLGIGRLLRTSPVFDFGPEFSSGQRLQSFLNMGPLTNYPADPNTVLPVFSSSRNTTLTIFGQESGHRFLAYPRYMDPLTNQPSSGLLGRDDAHWSFFFNSDASVEEGNRIEDRGQGQSPRFRTTDTVLHYSAFDQYLMGLRGAGEAPPSFLVRNPSIGFSTSHAPQPGIDFDGTRQDITVQMIIDAEGRRVPDATVAQKHFNFAFVLLVKEGAQPSAGALKQLETLRLSWEEFFSAAVDNRGTARTGLVKQLRLSTWPAGGVLRGSPGTVTVSIAAPLRSNLDVLLSSDSGILTVPAAVTIPAGSASVSFSITGNRQGVSELTARANDPAYDLARTLVQVREYPTQLRLEAVSGASQLGGRGATLANPVVWRLHDDNDVPFSGLSVAFSTSGDGAVTPSGAITNGDGLVSVNWRLASSGAANTLRASLDAAPSVTAQVSAIALDRPDFRAAGVVNAASFNTGAAAANTAISPGGLVSIFGTSLATNTATAVSFPLPLSLSSTSVTISGIAAPLIFVSPLQINLQAPFEVSGSTAEIVISTPAGQSPPVVAPLASTQPGIFFDSVTGQGAIVHNEDGALTSVRPARAGEFLQLYASGLGAVSPVVATGFPAPLSPLSLTVTQPQVTIGGRPAAVAFSGLAPGFAGLYQLTLQVPGDVPAGRQKVVLTANGLSSNEVFLNIQ